MVCGADLAVVLLLGSAVIVSSETVTINPSNDISVSEYSSATFSCSFSNPLPKNFHLLIGGASFSDDISLTVGSGRINMTQDLVALGGIYTVREFADTLAKVEFMVNASRRYNGYALQCFSEDRSSSNKTFSETIVLRVKYPPSSVPNETVYQFLNDQPHSFQLNCSDLLTGNPLPGVTWTYNKTWKFSVQPTGLNDSLLDIQISSLDLVPALLYNHAVTVVCTATNDEGSVSKFISLNVTGTPSAPQQVVCMSTTKNSACAIKCTWTAPVVSGTKPVSSYNLVIKRGGVVAYSTMIMADEPTEHYPPTSSFQASQSLSASMQAVNSLGSGPQSNINTFKSPGSCLMPYLTEAENNETSVTVNWTTPDCDGLPIDSFTVQTSLENGTSVFSKTLESQVRSLLISPLSPNTKYRIYVTSVNCAGSSEPAAVTVTTQSIRPEGTSPQPTVTPSVVATERGSSSTCLQNAILVFFLVLLSLLMRL
jgi:hypothetical protein